MFVSRAPGLEELDQLLARGVIVPFTIAAHDLDQLVERLLPTVISIQRYGKIKPRLVIERVGGDLLFQLGYWSKVSRLFGDFKGGTRRRHCGIISLGFRYLCQRMFGLLDVAGLQIGSRETGERVHIGRVAGQKFRI